MYLDGEIRIFDQEDIFEDAVYELVNGQNQMECTTNELKTTLLPEAPLLLESIRNEYYIVSPDEIIKDAMNINPILMNLYGYQYVVRTCANESLRKKALNDSRGMRELLKQERYDEYISGLNQYIVLLNENLKMFFQDGAISGVMSSKYVYLMQTDLLRVLKNNLEANFTGIGFCGGSVSDSQTIAYYKVENQDLLDTFTGPLSAKFAQEFIDGSQNLCVRFSTSDTTFNGANLEVGLIKERTYRPLGVNILLPHYGSANMEKFADNVLKIPACFTDGRKMLEDLAAVSILFPVNTAYNIADAYNIPIGVMGRFMQDNKEILEGLSTAADVWYVMNDLQYFTEKKRTEAVTIQLRSMLTNVAAWKEADGPEVYKKRENKDKRRSAISDEQLDGQTAFEAA